MSVTVPDVNVRGAFSLLLCLHKLLVLLQYFSNVGIPWERDELMDAESTLGSGRKPTYLVILGHIFPVIHELQFEYVGDDDLDLWTLQVVALLIA